MARIGENAAMQMTTDGEQLLDLDLPWDNSFARLGEDFFTRLAPQPLTAPYWVGRSRAVAGLLGLAPAPGQSDELLQVFCGNRALAGSEPLASVYSGHQFGQWAGQLGDGRAILLGETAGMELQLKGSGLTPYSRMGDGRAVLRSSIREFLCSEAMHGLGIPTSRALCVTGSDQPVRRESLETAAVVTRVAPSFIRFGHFEHFSARNQVAQLKILADYVIDRFYPACRHSGQSGGNAYASLLQAVSLRTADMVARWQAAGFCHGVMNTDNMSILGLTIDYGPFQFLDAFDPRHVCNHSDDQGRYAFNQQPNIAHWNLFCLGQALLPLIGDTELALAALECYQREFPARLQQLMCAKLGLADVVGVNGHLPGIPAAADEAKVTPRPVSSADQPLVEDILKLLAQERVDYSIFWRRLSHTHTGIDPQPVRDLFLDRSAADAWLLRYSERVKHIPRALVANLMLKTNPKFVLRNYLCEQAIEQAKQKNFSGVATLLALLESPFDEHPGFGAYADFPPDWASGIRISCSS
jgi:uncharacterized protein YdiU (UPF0061 family)